MRLFIQGMGIISPQETWANPNHMPQPVSYNENKLCCIEPDYTKYIDVKQIRRMSRIIRMGVASAKIALDQAELTVPDAIITATGYGCLDDSGIFLTKMIENNEQAVNPTPFIQSTHNTIGSQIALLLQCQGYNQTYAHGAFSFESALLDAMMMATENSASTILLGAVDEITDISHGIQSRFGVFRKRVQRSLELLNTSGKGTLNGEGAAFFLVSGNQNPKSIACVLGLCTLYKPTEGKLKNGIDALLRENKLTLDEIDLVLSGFSGDAKSDEMLSSLLAGIMDSSRVEGF